MKNNSIEKNENINNKLIILNNKISYMSNKIEIVSLINSISEMISNMPEESEIDLNMEIKVCKNINK